MKNGLWIIWFLLTLLMMLVLVDPTLHSNPHSLFGTMAVWFVVAVLCLVVAHKQR